MELKKKIVLINISKALRNFHNGAFYSSFFYFPLAATQCSDPIFVPILLFIAILSATIKSKLLTYIQKIGKSYTLLIVLTLYVFPFVAFLNFNVKYFYYFGQLITMALIGFFPLDGQEIIIFEEIQRRLICCQRQLSVKSHILRIYSIIGYIFQAIGSVMSIFYLTYKLQEVQFNEYTRIRQLLVVLYFIGFVNIGFYSLFFIQKYCEKTQLTQEKYIQTIQKDCQKINKIRYFSIANGFTFGLLSAPFLMYFMELRYSLYFDKMSVIIFCFFLFKGLGQEFMSKYTKLERIYKYWNSLGNISLVSIVFIRSQNLGLFLLILSFPIWNYSRVKLKQLISFEGSQTLSWQKLIYWERLGTACGIFVCALSFRIFYTHYYFGYPFILSGIIKLIVSKQISSLNQNKQDNNYKDKNNDYNYIGNQICYDSLFKNQQNQLLGIQNMINSNQKQQQQSSSLLLLLIQLGSSTSKNQTFDHNQNNNTFHNFGRTRKSIFSVIIVIILLFIYVSSQTLQVFDPKINNQVLIEKYFIYRAKGDNFDYPYIKLFNHSLAHYLIRQNITNIKLANCDSFCLSQYSSRKQYYDQLTYDTGNIQWHHYASMKYFRTSQQAQHVLTPILYLPKQVKGFSLIWQNPQRYNKMPDETNDFMISFIETHGFYFDQMPSLNLRGVENKILFIFTRTKRYADKLHLPLVKKPPRQNYLAIQNQLKMINHYRFMRQYILYHLHIGVDKFFFYNNDRNQNQTNFYSSNNQAGQMTSKCFNTSIDHQMSVFSEIWQQFYDHIIYIPWRIKSLQHHPQRQTYLHYSIYYQKITKFTARTDFDQFIFTPSDKYLPDYLEELLINHDLTNIQMKGQPFMDILCYKKQLILQQFVRYSHTTQFQSKSIVLTKLMAGYLIQKFASKNGGFAKLYDPIHEIVYFHYNRIQPNIGPGFIDDSMKPYISQMKQSCKGKCSDSTLKPSCPSQYYNNLISKYCTLPQ